MKYYPHTYTTPLLTSMRVEPRHLLLGPVARVPPRHLGLDVRDELRPRAADDGVRALRARDAEALE